MLLFLCNNGISELFTSSYFYYFHHFDEVWVTYCKLKLLSWNKSCMASRWMRLMKQALWCRPTDLWLPASASLRLRDFSGGQSPLWVSPAGQMLEGIALHPSMTAVGGVQTAQLPVPWVGNSEVPVLHWTLEFLKAEDCWVTHSRDQMPPWKSAFPSLSHIRIPLPRVLGSPPT